MQPCRTYSMLLCGLTGAFACLAGPAVCKSPVIFDIDRHRAAADHVLATLLSDPGGLARSGAIWIDGPGSQATLFIPVEFVGLGATDEIIAAIVRRDDTLSIANPELRIQVVPTRNPIDGVLNKIDLNPGFDTATCGPPGECVNTLGDHTAHINSEGREVVGAAAHEILHFAGIKDRYLEGPRDAEGNRTSVPGPGYTDRNIMVSRTGTELKPEQMLEAKSSPLTKECTGSNLGFGCG